MKGELSSFMGIPIHISPFIPEKEPVIELSSRVNVSNEFRKKVNNWYVEIFGYKSCAYVFNGEWATNPKTLARIKINIETGE